MLQFEYSPSASPVFCSLVCIHNNTQKWINGEKRGRLFFTIFTVLPLPCIILNATKEQKNEGDLGMRLGEVLYHAPKWLALLVVTEN